MSKTTSSPKVKPTNASRSDRRRSASRSDQDRKSTRLNSSHMSISYIDTLSLHDDLPIFKEIEDFAPRDAHPQWLQSSEHFSMHFVYGLMGSQAELADEQDDIEPKGKAHQCQPIRP